MTPADIKATLLAYLARRDYSRHELYQRLTQKGGDPDSVNAALDTLAACGDQSDLRYSLQVINSRAQRGYGPGFIRQWLRQKGVAKDVIDDALQQCEQDWFELAHRCVLSRSGSRARGDTTQWRKQFLYRRGFAMEHIAHALTDPGELPDAP